MAGPYSQVEATFGSATEYAATAITALTDFTTALGNTIYTPPTLNMSWKSPGPKGIESIGSAAIPGVDAVETDGKPDAGTFDIPDITIDEFTDPEPILQFPPEPVITIGPTPPVPPVAPVPVPNAPVIQGVPTPTYLTLNTPSFDGVDLHEDYLSRLSDIPELTLVSPTPFRYARGPEYASELLANLKAVLNERMKGGTGLAPAVEQAIWDRARSRETQLGLANEAEVMRNSEAMGFQLPSGVLAAQLREAQRAYYDKLSGLSRDVAIKQAELEQENLKQTIAAGMQLEGQLVDYSFKLEQMTFEAAKTAADNAIQAHNAGVERFKALMTAYGIYASAYENIIKAELAKVEVYKARLQGERAKAEINTVMVQQFKAQIEAGMAQVEIYKAHVGGANALVQLEQAKVGAAGEQIKAYVAQVNAETAKVEAYKAGVQAQLTKLEEYRAKIQAFVAKTGAQAEKARAEISRYSAQVQAKGMEWEGYKALMAARGARAQSQGAAASSAADAFRAKASAIEAGNNSNARQWEASIKQYEAGQALAVQTGKINGDFVIQTNNARLEAAKAGAQVHAQVVSSALGMFNANASISGTSSASMSVGYSYGGDVSGAVPAITGVYGP